jgi:hypothetical protein
VNDFIDIPIVEICDGWTVEDLKTEDDCDDAFAYLTGAIVAIEAKIDDMEILGNDRSTDYIRTKSALRWKKAAINICQRRRAQVSRKASDAKEESVNFRILAYVRAAHPDVMAAAVNHAVAGLEYRGGET